MTREKIQRRDNELWTSYLLQELGEEGLYVMPLRVESDDYADENFWYSNDVRLREEGFHLGISLETNPSLMFNKDKKRVLWPPIRSSRFFKDEKVYATSTLKLYEDFFGLTCAFKGNNVKLIPENANGLESQLVSLYNPNGRNLNVNDSYEPQEVVNCLVEYAKNPFEIMKNSRYNISGQDYMDYLKGGNFEIRRERIFNEKINNSESKDS